MGTSSHPIHRHQLVLKSYKKPYTCDGCKELGFGARYRCEKCNFDFHKQCWFASPIAHHDFFKNSIFKFLGKPPQKCSHNCQDCKRFCDACTKPVTGFFYHCEEEGWDLHPFCHNLPVKLSVDNVKFKLRNKVATKCFWCKKKNLEGSMSGIRGWCYVSECKEYLFHVHCATEMMLDLWRNYGDFSSDDDDNNNLHLASLLENLELPAVQSQLRGNRSGSGSKFIKMMKLVLKAVVGILLGDPTVLLSGLVVGLISK